MKFIFVLFIIVSMLVVGCSDSTEPKPDPSEPVEPISSSPGGEEFAPRKLNIGDVEASLTLRANVANESLIDQIKTANLESPTGKLNLVRVFVSEPYPRQLWLTLDIIDNFSYPNNPVMISGIIYRQVGNGEEVPIGQVNTIVGVDKETIQAEPETYGSRRQRIDVLADMETVPETMLVQLRAKAMLFREGSDLTSLNPEEASASTTLYSNPVRIEFNSEETNAM